MIASTADLRRSNRAQIVRQLARHQSLDRQSISASTGLTGAAVSRITRELIDAGLVQELPTGSGHSRPGRPSNALKLHDQGVFVLAMVITANRKSVTLANCHGAVAAHRDLKLADPSDAEATLQQYAAAALALIERSGIERRRLIGASVVVAANTPASRRGRVSSSVLGWRREPVTEPLQRQLRIPVHVESRSAALLQTELWQRRLHSDATIVLINNGLAMSTSVLLNQQLLESGSGRLGQLSHLAISTDQTRCECGARGCLGAVATGNAVIREVARDLPGAWPAATPPYQQLSRCIDMAAAGQHVAVDAFRRAGANLAHGIHALIELIQPQTIYLAGETGRQADFFASAVEQLAREYAGQRNCTLAVSEASSVTAAVRIALNHFVFSEQLNLAQLRA